ncbi:axonemal dynein light intermediate polypeptide 1-like [Neosynchiropus ocellatus]
MATSAPGESLLKYDTPILITKTPSVKPQKGRSQKSSATVPSDNAPVPPAPKQKSASAEATSKQNEDILNAIFPPREWSEGNQLWMQKVSTTPCSRSEVLALEEQLDTKLQQRQAREAGLCPARRELFSQFFDELIRQETINCAERGLLLLRVRNEIQLTMATYNTLYESSVAFAIRKALQAEQDKADIGNRITELEQETHELKKQLSEQMAKSDAIEKSENEKNELQEKKHKEEIQFLKSANHELKTQLEMIITPKK